jgi:hypothetical protein
MNTDPEATARQILDIIINFYRRKVGGMVNPVHTQIKFMDEHPAGNFNEGWGYMFEKNWIEPHAQRGGFMQLTETGYGEAMNLGWACKDVVSIEKKDGTVIPGVKAQVGSGIIIPNDKVAIESGDVVLRQIPNGGVERLVITNPGYHAANLGFPGHYQASYQHEHAMQQSRPLHIQVTGNNSRFNYNSTDNSTNVVHVADLDFPVLTEEFGRLREALIAQKPTTVEQFSALAKIAEAEAAAKKEDSSSLINALTAMGKVAGKWAYDAGMEFSAKTAAELISKYAVG